MACALSLMAVRDTRGHSFQSLQLILSGLRVWDSRSRIHATKPHQHLYRRSDAVTLQETNSHAPIKVTQPCSYDTHPPPATLRGGPYPTSAKRRGCARQSTLAPTHPASVTAVRQRSPSPCFVCPRRPHPKPTHRRHPQHPLLRLRRTPECARYHAQFLRHRSPVAPGLRKCRDC